MSIAYIYDFCLEIIRPGMIEYACPMIVKSPVRVPNIVHSLYPCSCCSWANFAGKGSSSYSINSRLGAGCSLMVSDLTVVRSDAQLRDDLCCWNARRCCCFSWIKSGMARNKNMVGAFGTWLLFFHILGISSSRLTFIFFQRGRYTTKQKINQVVSDVQFRWVSPKLVYLPVPSMNIPQFTIVNHHIGR